MHLARDGRSVADLAQARCGAREAARGAGRDRGPRFLKGFRLAALDLDGTLVDSAPDLANCLGRALGAAGLPSPTLADARGWIGDGVEALVRRGLTAGLGAPPGRSALDAALAVFHRCYRARLFVASRLYPRVPETLEALRARGLALGCVTNKPEAYTNALLEQAGIAGLLDFAFGGDTFDSKKPDPTPLVMAAERFGVAPAEAVMVGDSINDRDAARAAGFAFVFAAYGYSAANDPELTRADAVIVAFSDLSRLLSA